MEVAIFMLIFWLGFERYDMRFNQKVRRSFRPMATRGYQPPKWVK